MLAIISVSVFVRLNWIYKSLMSSLAVLVYIVIVLAVRPCLFDDYDKSVYGICWDCSWIFNLKYIGVVQLLILLLAIILLGRHVRTPVLTYTQTYSN